MKVKSPLAFMLMVPTPAMAVVPPDVGSTVTVVVPTKNWVILRASPSTSLSFESTFPLIAESSSPVKLSSAATGASLTAMIVISNKPVSVPPLPSLIA